MKRYLTRGSVLIMFTHLSVALWAWAGWKQSYRRGYDRPAPTPPLSTSTRACRTSQHISTHRHETYRHSHIYICCPVGTNGRAKHLFMHFYYVYCCILFFVFLIWPHGAAPSVTVEGVDCLTIWKRGFTETLWEGRLLTVLSAHRWRSFLEKKNWLLIYFFCYRVVVCFLSSFGQNCLRGGSSWSYWFVFHSPIFHVAFRFMTVLSPLINYL